MRVWPRPDQSSPQASFREQMQAGRANRTGPEQETVLLLKNHRCAGRLLRSFSSLDANDASTFDQHTALFDVTQLLGRNDVDVSNPGSARRLITGRLSYGRHREKRRKCDGEYLHLKAPMSVIVHSLSCAVVTLVLERSVIEHEVRRSHSFSHYGPRYSRETFPDEPGGIYFVCLARLAKRFPKQCTFFPFAFCIPVAWG